MNRIYLVRHGENLANLTHEFSSRKVDYSLTPKGRLQAQQTGEFFRDKNIHGIYASPLKRARETAEIIGDILNLPVTVVESFRELDVGELEGQPVSLDLWKLHDEIVKGWYHGHPERSFPGGDNHFTLCQRMQSGLRTVLAGKQGSNDIIVGHGGMFTFTLKDLCPGVDIKTIARTVSTNCSITEILFPGWNGHVEGELVSWGACDHISGEAAQFVSGRP